MDQMHDQSITQISSGGRRIVTQGAEHAQYIVHFTDIVL